MTPPLNAPHCSFPQRFAFRTVLGALALGLLACASDSLSETPSTEATVQTAREEQAYASVGYLQKNLDNGRWYVTCGCSAVRWSSAPPAWFADGVSFCVTAAACFSKQLALHREATVFEKEPSPTAIVRLNDAALPDTFHVGFGPSASRTNATVSSSEDSQVRRVQAVYVESRDVRATSDGNLGLAIVQFDMPLRWVPTALVVDVMNLQKELLPSIGYSLSYFNDESIPSPSLEWLVRLVGYGTLAPGTLATRKSALFCFNDPEKKVTELMLHPCRPVEIPDENDLGAAYMVERGTDRSMGSCAGSEGIVAVHAGTYRYQIDAFHPYDHVTRGIRLAEKTSFLDAVLTRFAPPLRVSAR